MSAPFCAAQAPPQFRPFSAHRLSPASACKLPRFQAEGSGTGRLPTMPTRCKIELPSDAKFLGVVRAAVDRWCILAGFGETDTRQITLAVDEAVANIIRHAYAGRDSGMIVAEFTWDGRQLIFELEDAGAPVDRSRICKHPPDELHTGGRGTHFMREIMDEVDYQTLPSRNRVRLVKYRPAPAA